MKSIHFEDLFSPRADRKVVVQNSDFIVKEGGRATTEGLAVAEVAMGKIDLFYSPCVELRVQFLWQC